MYPEHQEEKTRRIVSWLDGKPRGPVKMEVEISDLCNLKCKFCWQRSSPRAKNVDIKRELSGKRWLELVDESARLGALEWRICGGGEPMCRKDDCLAILHRIKEKGMAGHLTTNGTYFKDEDIRKLVELEWDAIEFSLEGPNPEVNDPLRGEGVFNKVLEAGRRFVHWKRTLNKDKPRIIIASVLVSENYFFLADMIEFCHREGFQKFCVNPLTVMGSPTPEGLLVQKMKLKDEEQAKLVPIILKGKELADKYGIETNIEQFLELALIASTNVMDRVIASDVQRAKKEVEDRKEEHNKSQDKLFKLPDKYNLPCYAPWYCIAIRPYGKVGACVLFDETYQDLHQMSLEEVWFGDVFTQMREALKKGEIPWYCRKCSPNNVGCEREIRERIRYFIHQRRLQNSLKMRVKSVLKKLLLTSSR